MGYVEETTWKRIWAVVGYTVVPVLSFGAGCTYGYGTTGRLETGWPAVVFVSLVIVAAGAMASVLHVQAYVLPQSAKGQSPDSETLEWMRKLVKVWNAILKSAGIIFGVGVVAYGARYRAWDVAALAGIGYAIPLAAYQHTIARLTENARLNGIQKQRESASYERLMLLRNQLVAPTLLATYVPFLVGASVFLSEAAAFWTIVLLAAIWIAYACIHKFTDEIRAFLVGCFALLGVGMLAWLVCKFAGWPAAQAAFGLNLFALLYGLYMGAFEYIGVIQVRMADGAHRTSYGLPCAPQVPASKSHDYYVSSSLWLAAFFALYPVTFLADDLQLLFVYSVAGFGCLTWVFWVLCSPQGTQETKPRVKWLTWFKATAYALPLMVALGRVPATGTEVNAGVIATLWVAAASWLLAWLATPNGLRRTIRQELTAQRFSARSLLLSGATAALAAATAAMALNLTRPTIGSYLFLTDQSVLKLSHVALACVFVSLAAMTAAALYARDAHPMATGLES